MIRLAWQNLSVVQPGILYRSSHPTPGHLTAWTRRLGLRSIINLRGARACGSDALSRDTAKRLGLAHYDMGLESRGAPHRDRILRLTEIYQTMATPALIHCKSGADRAGLAAGIFVLLQGGTAAKALRQLALWPYGHISASSTGILDAFFRLYAATAEGKTPFLDWVRTEYGEHALKRDFRTHGLANFINDNLLRRE